ncbi:MAG: hypothetical protein II297_00975, partial [Clostridia bacterium]|nr:hypothetical protein [Clostridia bacterium]
TVGAQGSVTVSSVSSSVTGSVINAGLVAVEAGKKLTADAIENAGTLSVTAAGLDVDELINLWANMRAGRA